MRLTIDPNVEAVEHDGVRWYPIAGRWWPSCTSVLHHTKVDGAALQRWKDENDSPEALARVEALRDAGAERGHLLNAEVEAWDLRSEAPRSTWGRSIRKALGDIDAVHARELPVLHPELGVASRFDMLCCYMGRDVVIDWKTARKPKRLDWIGDYVEQVAFYVGAAPLCYPDLPAPTHGAVIVALEQHRLRCPTCGWEATLTYDADCPACCMPTDTVWTRERDAQRFHLDPEQLRAAFDRFAERCRLFHMIHDPPDLPIPTPTAAVAAE